MCEVAWNWVWSALDIVSIILTSWGWDKMADEIFKWIFLTENDWISYRIHHKMGPFGNKTVMIKTMDWHRPSIIRTSDGLVFWCIYTVSENENPYSGWCLSVVIISLSSNNIYFACECDYMCDATFVSVSVWGGGGGGGYDMWYDKSSLAV